MGGAEEGCGVKGGTLSKWQAQECVSRLVETAQWKGERSNAGPAMQSP